MAGSSYPTHTGAHQDSPCAHSSRLRPTEMGVGEKCLLLISRKGQRNGGDEKRILEGEQKDRERRCLFWGCWFILLKILWRSQDLPDAWNDPAFLQPWHKPQTRRLIWSHLQLISAEWESQGTERLKRGARKAGCIGPIHSILIMNYENISERCGGPLWDPFCGYLFGEEF